MNADARMRLLFFIPSFNDQQGLPELVQLLLEKYPHAKVLVVDDGSMPAIDLSRVNSRFSYRFCLFRFPFNVGLGLGTSVAIDYFLRNEFEFLIRLDADGQHPIDEIPELLAPLHQGHADVVWGERTNHLGVESARAIAGSFLKQTIAWVGRRVLRSEIRDWFSGFFAMNRRSAKFAAQFHLERYCELQMLCIFHGTAIRIATRHVRQADRQFGETSINWFDGIMIFMRSSLIMIRYAIRGSSE